MCDQNCIEWVRENIEVEDIRGKRVLEVGSFNVNGTLKPTLKALGPSEYIGVDIHAGSNVDIICPAERLVNCFGDESFDVIISTCTLEHVLDWRKAISNIKRVCKPGGMILLIVPSDWPFHAFPWDYWRYSPEDLKKIFADCQILALAEDPALPQRCVYIKLSKPEHFAETNLAGYALYSSIANRRVVRLNFWHYVNRRFAGIVLHHVHLGLNAFTSRFRARFSL